VTRFRLGDADQKKYHDGGTWYTYDPAVLDDLTAGQLIELEGTMNTTFDEIEHGLFRGSAKARCCVMWVARYLAGVREDWETFEPLVRRAEWVETDPDGGPAVPPAEATGASPSSPPATSSSPAASPAS
jgi:hypothetical protein